MTLAVKMELKQKMDEFAFINWSAVARKAFIEKLAELEFLKEVQAKTGTMTEKDLADLRQGIQEKLAKQYN